MLKHENWMQADNKYVPKILSRWWSPRILFCFKSFQSVCRVVPQTDDRQYDGSFVVENIGGALKLLDKMTIIMNKGNYVISVGHLSKLYVDSNPPEASRTIRTLPKMFGLPKVTVNHSKQVVKKKTQKLLKSQQKIGTRTLIRQEMCSTFG